MGNYISVGNFIGFSGNSHKHFFSRLSPALKNQCPSEYAAPSQKKLPIRHLICHLEDEFFISIGQYFALVSRNDPVKRCNIFSFKSKTEKHLGKWYSPVKRVPNKGKFQQAMPLWKVLYIESWLFLFIKPRMI